MKITTKLTGILFVLTLWTTTVNGQEFFEDGSMKLTEVSTDKKYGYEPNHKTSIKVGKIENEQAFLKTYGQTNGCDTVYNYLEVMPEYDKGVKGLFDYLMKELVPIIGNCMKRDTELIASLYIILTIDSNGKVIDVTFPKNNLSLLCKEELKTKLLIMTGWTAGQKDGKPVCCKFDWPISCLKWD